MAEVYESSSLSPPPHKLMWVKPYNWTAQHRVLGPNELESPRHITLFCDLWPMFDLNKGHFYAKQLTCPISLTFIRNVTPETEIQNLLGFFWEAYTLVREQIREHMVFTLDENLPSSFFGYYNVLFQLVGDWRDILDGALLLIWRNCQASWIQAVSTTWVSSMAWPRTRSLHLWEGWTGELSLVVAGVIFLSHQEWLQSSLRSC